MKKIYWIIVFFIIFIFGYQIISELPSISNKISIISQNYINNTKFSYYGTANFKSTHENKELLNEFILINSKFIKSPPIKFPSDSKKEIKYFYKLSNLYPNFNNYYIVKKKIEKALFNELPLLYEATYNLDDLLLKSYFDNNSNYISDKWGISNYFDFYEFILTIKKLNINNITSYQLEDTYFIIPDQSNINFQIMITSENVEPIYITVLSELYNKKSITKSPKITFLGESFGGES